MKGEPVPSDSRYIPFVQQPYCCVPACIQIVLYKNDLPLLPQEEIGAALGLVVPTDAKDAFYNVETSDKPPVSSGFGTRIQIPEYGLPALIKKRNWPFKLEPLFASEFRNVSSFAQKLEKLVSADTDALICFQNDQGFGHVSVLDRVIGDTVRIIDPSPQSPKWHSMAQQELFDRVRAHGDANYAGVWILSRQ